MKEQKTIYLLNEADLEAEIYAVMEELDMAKASMLLDEIDMNETAPDHTYIQDIKERTIKKLGLEDRAAASYGNDTEGKDKESSGEKKGMGWKGYIAAVAVIILAILAGFKHDIIVLAFQDMLSLIPGVGIVKDNQEAEYRLKEQVAAENDQCSLKILYVTATDDTMTVRFDLEGTFTEEQKQREKKQEKVYDKLDVFLLVNNQKFQKYQGSSAIGTSGGQFSYNCNYTFEVDQKYINTKKEFTLVCEEYNIQVSFRLSEIEKYNSMSEIGATETHNGISLTASASLKDGQLSINIYPTNNSKYNLISFEREYNLEYFGKKMTLNTDKGMKEYTPPNYYGTGLNAPFLFDVSDGSRDFELSIPFVAVETEEKKETELPIPEEREAMEVNKEIKFENGSAIIKSVERLAGDKGSEYGYLKIFLEYTSLSENQQLVGVEFIGKGAIGSYTHYDDQNRISAISYILNESDTEELKLSVIKPRYVLMDSYQLDISVK